MLGDSIILRGSGASTYPGTIVLLMEFHFLLTNGIYVLIGTDANGCENTDQLEITVFQLPNVNFLL